MAESREFFGDDVECGAESDVSRADRNRVMPGMIDAARAAKSELRMISRRPKPESLFASSKTLIAPSRTSSRPRVAWRSSMYSLSDMTDLPQ